jgi:stearoyl-CoA 9-desaturase NADPH oxidoreductase
MKSTPLPLFWRSTWLKPLNDVQGWNTLLQGINGTWSIDEVRARVVRVVHECADVVSLYLKPNRLFKGFKPGQYLALTLPCNGVLQGRSFSLSSAPRADGVIRLTIKSKVDGLVSKAAAALKIGAVVQLSQAAGHFGQAEPQGKQLLIAAGSGITPMMAILQDWAKREPRPDVTLIYSCRNAAHWLFREELQTLVHQWPELRVVPHFSAEQGRFAASALPERVTDIEQRQTLLCGPEAFMADITAFYHTRGLQDQLQQEHFQTRKAELNPDAARFQVFSAAGQNAFSAANGQSLLEAAEQEGLKPMHGCRRGICMTCQCRKLSGVVHNRLTDTRSTAGEGWIQLCVSTPLSDLHLEL